MCYYILQHLRPSPWWATASTMISQQQNYKSTEIKTVMQPNNY